MRVTCLCTLQDRERSYAPGSIIEVSDQDGRDLIRKGSAKLAPAAKTSAPAEADGKPGRKGRRKPPLKPTAKASVRTHESPDDDAIASTLIELAEDDSKVDEEGKPTAAAVSEALGREISNEDLDRVWASLQD